MKSYIYPDRQCRMQPRWSPKCTPAWAVITAAVISAAGCASVSQGPSASQKGSVHTLAGNSQHQSARIVYHSESDRLNVWAAGQAAEGSSSPLPAAWLPGVSTCKLEIVHPHPQGTAGYALATLVFSPLQDEGQGGGIWETMTRTITGGEPPQPRDPVADETWLLEIPAAQVDGILAKLRQQNFFQRSKTLNPAVFLRVELDGTGFGKEFRAVPELDALIVRTRQQGRNAASSGLASGFRRLPRVR